MSNVPKLRFKEFSGEWKLTKLDEVIVLISGQHLTPEEYQSEKNNAPYFTGPSDYTNNLGMVTKWALKESKVSIANDVLITVKGSGVGELFYLTLNKVIIGRQLMAIRVKEASSNILYQLLTLRRNTFQALASGNMIPGLSRQDILNQKFLLPSKSEQDKIASFLTSVDTKIEQLIKKEALLQQYKKGVMQKIFKQEIRFRDDDGREYPEWEKRKLKDVLFEHKTKSSGQEEVFSVSVHKGLINQIEHLGRSFSAKNVDNYNLVKPYDIVYTKSPTGHFPYGIIKHSKIKKDVIVSPLYGVFTPETASLGYMLNVYFESRINTHNYLHSIVQKGAKNTMNITNTTFLSKALVLPVSKREQEKIANFLSSIDSKLEKVQKQLDSTKEYKKALLQQMFV